MQSIERWKAYPAHDAYEVSDFGRVRRAAPASCTYVGRVLRGGRDRGMAKLNESSVSAIKLALKGSGAMHRELAARYGVSRSTITNIARGCTWTHVSAGPVPA